MSKKINIIKYMMNVLTFNQNTLRYRQEYFVLQLNDESTVYICKDKGM